MECSGDADAGAHSGAQARTDSGHSASGRGAVDGGLQHCPDCELPKPKRWHQHPFYYLRRSPRSWVTCWQAPRGGLVEQKMGLRGDFRDHAPPLFSDVYAAYRPVVRNGWWTMGAAAAVLGQPLGTERGIGPRPPGNRRCLLRFQPSPPPPATPRRPARNVGA